MFVLFNSRRQERREGYKKALDERETYLTPVFGFIFLFLEKYPFGFILNWLKRSCKCVQPHSIVEFYVIAFLLLEILIFCIVLLCMPLYLWAVIPITVFLGMRFLDILQSWVNVHLVQPTEGILYASRTLLLTLFNYVELILGFSVLAYIWNNTFEPIIDSLSKSAIFTLGTMTAIGSRFEPVSGGAWAIYISEIGFAIFFLIIVVVRALTYFESKIHHD